MAGAFTTLKVPPEDHQALQALLKYLMGKGGMGGITMDQFRAVLQTQGRSVANTPDEDLVAAMADMLVRVFG
ncbi:hypothetical protein LCGC14_1157760 [marine sediment metagenome]|uniref:Uncharacterized protein n=1 Tax=marine sediment metagenome TaxID=412755 RepID=A0A0F9PBW7_9ZZZZ